MDQVDNTAKVALSRVIFRERNAGRVRAIVFGVRDSGEEEENMEWRCVEQKLSSRNSRFAAVVSSMGDMWRWKETSS